MLVAGVDADEAKAALVEMLGVFANKIDAWLVAEGVKTEAEARRLIDLGVLLTQGYFFGRPAAAWTSPDPALCESLRSRVGGAKAGTLGALVETVAWVGADKVAQATQRLRAGAAAMFVVLDADRRPVGVLTRESVRRGEASAPRFADVNSSAREIAQRLATRRPTDTASPAVVSDNAGRYVGVVTIPRLLAALADL